MADDADGGAVAPGDAINAKQSGAAGVMSNDELAAEVKRCKTALDGKETPAEEMLAALIALKQMGALPTKVLSETLIGKSVNAIAKGGDDQKGSKMAKELVEIWRQQHRKRKAAVEGGNPDLKRGKSSTFSLGSEAPSKDAAGGLPASQEPPASSTDWRAAGFDAPPAAAPTGEAVDSQMSRADSLLSVDGESGAPLSQDMMGNQEEAVAPYRAKVRQKLLEALGKAEEIEAKDGKEGDVGEEMRDPVKLADEIDQELHKCHPKKEEYMAKARSILFNVKDKKNRTFKFKLMMGFFNSSDIPKLTAEDMASDEKNSERDEQRKQAMAEIDQDWMKKNGGASFTGMFTCGKCKGTKTTYFQLQTRSSDEPMTTFVTCATCSNRWKFC